MDRHSLTPEDPTRMPRGLLLLPLALLFVSALPDAMVVPVLHDLMVKRYGVSPAAAHAFMCINLVGALASIGLVGRLRRSGRDGAIVAGAALLNGLLLALMALPIGFAPTLAVRFVEGVADLVVYAFLFDFLARAGRPETRGRRMGAAATCLMLGIASGIGIGGVAGGIDPLLSLWLGAAACLLVAPSALLMLRTEAVLGQRTEHAPGSGTVEATRPLWPALVMMFSDRAVAGVLVSTVPLFLASMAGMDAHAIGGAIGLSMLMTALGAWPAGRLADRIGPMRMRLVAGIVYAAGFAAIVTTAFQGTALLIAVMLAFGAAGAALFAASLTLVVESGRGPAGMAAYHAAGNLGFLVGPATGGAAMKLLGGADAGVGVYAGIIVGFALLHVLATTVSIVGTSMFWRRLNAGRRAAAPAAALA